VVVWSYRSSATTSHTRHAPRLTNQITHLPSLVGIPALELCNTRQLARLKVCRLEFERAFEELDAEVKVRLGEEDVCLFWECQL
jgi:hypothetical protein